MTKAETTKTALMIKLKIVDVLNGAMIRKNVDYKTMAKDLRISQTRIKALLSTSDLTLDLFSLLAVTKYLNVRLIVRSGKNIIYKAPKLPSSKPVNRTS